MRRVVLACALCACNSSDITVVPVIDVPVNDTASAFPLDSITLSAAHSGNPLDITAATFTKGQTVDLGGIPFSDDLVLHMVGRVGTSDVAYGRTCAFTLDQNATVPQPHLYFSRSVKFGQLGFSPLLRVGGAAVTYHDGSGILIGGMSPDGSMPVTDVERFDPNAGEYRPLTSLAARIGSVVALLGTGSETLVAVIGGVDMATGSGATYVETIEAENPADRRVDLVEPTNNTMERIGLTATTLTSGDVVVMGGSGGNGSDCGSGIDPSTCASVISLSSGMPSVEGTHGTLLHGRWNHTATRLGNDVDAPVLVAGGIGFGSGSSAPAPVAAAELYKPLTRQFSSPFNAMMVVPRSQHHAVRLPDGSVLMIGGIDASGQAVRQIEMFTLDGGFLIPPASDQLPAAAGAIDITATSLPDGTVLVTGGRPAPGAPPVTTAVLVDINSNTGGIEVLATDHLNVARAGHSATVLCDGSVLISGGTQDPAPAEIYNPPASKYRR